MAYIQTMYLVSKLRRIPRIGNRMYLIAKWICRHITGHQWSKTDWGYGGGGVDVWCRWCNQFETITVKEAEKIFPNMRKTVWDTMGVDPTNLKGMPSNGEW